MDFIDLKTQQKRIRESLDARLAKVLDHGQYIMGPEIFELEEKLQQFCKAKHAITCADGTKALILVLLAKNIGPGDAVFIPSFTFAATAEVVALVGATPVFVDVLPDTFNMDPQSLEDAIDSIKGKGLKQKAIITVDLFGQPCDYHAIAAIARDHGLYLIADGAQSFGAEFHGKAVGTLADCTTTSFFPAKPLGCYGDGGAIFTNDDHVAEIIKSLRNHGQGQDRYDNVRVGLNGRLDTMQAAVLLEKLAIFPEEIILRNKVADEYNRAFESLVPTPYVIPSARSVWAQYTVLVENRAQIQAELREKGIPTMVYYLKPMHQQGPYLHYPKAPHGLPATEQLAHAVLSLPMHPYLNSTTQQIIVDAFVESVQNNLLERTARHA